MLTDIQRRMLDAIDLYWQQKGYAPTFREISYLGNVSSTSVVAYNLRRLRDLGLVTFDEMRTRTVRRAA